MMHSINVRFEISFSRSILVSLLMAGVIVAPASAQGSKAVTTTRTTTGAAGSTVQSTTKTITTAAKTSSTGKTASSSKGGSILNEPTAAPTGKNVDVWELKQTSNMVGPITCLISPQAVRLRAEKMGITWMFKAPKWDAYLFNTETKNYCSFPYSEWKDKAFFMPSQKSNRAKSDLAQMKVEKTGKTLSIAGSKATEVGLIRQNGTKYGELWMANDIVAPKQFAEVVGSMVMVPIKTGGTPLRAAIFKERAGKIVQVLDTTSATKKSLDSCVFEPMKGFNKVKDEMALLFAESPEGSSGMFESQNGKSPLRGPGGF